MGAGGWLAVAIAFGAAGYATYLAGLRRHLIEPSRASWLIWSVATGVEAATYAAVNTGAPQRAIFALSAIACIVVTLAMWRRSRWTAPTPTEAACMATSLAAIVLWLPLRETFWAHMLVLAAVPLGFWPTWRSVWEDRARERSPAWGLWTLGDLATLFVAARTPGFSIGEYGYIAVEFACHASVWLLVGLDTLNPGRSLGRRVGGLRLLDAYLPASPLAVGENHLGKAAFAARAFSPGDAIVRFGGRRVDAARLPRPLVGASDRYLQVGARDYLGPSGRIDDVVNHSCAPNAGLRFGADGVWLVAIRGIAPGEEVSWDYSTTLAEGEWRMACRCGAPACRGTIGPFATLPPDRQRWYRERELVAPYLLPRRVERAA